MTAFCYQRSGHLDRSFGADGAATVGLSRSTFSEAFKVRRNGGLIIGWDAFTTDANHDIGAVSLQQTGAIDRAFGRKGKVKVDFGGADWLAGVVLQGSAKAVLVATSRDETPPYGHNRTALARLSLHPH